MATANNTRAAELFETAKPYLLELLENAPQFGTAGLNLIFHEGSITRVDFSASVQRKAPKTGGR
jgi:hypothetical protein